MNFPEKENNPAVHPRALILPCMGDLFRHCQRTQPPREAVRRVYTFLNWELPEQMQKIENN